MNLDGIKKRLHIHLHGENGGLYFFQPSSPASADYYEKIYYYNESGEKKTPTIKNMDSVYPSVYLVKGIVYYGLEEPSGFYGTYSTNVEKENARTLKGMIGRLLFSLANGLHWLTGMALGETVTIDDLVFNNYADTNISFFDSKEEVGEDNASPLIYGHNEVGGLDTVINKWYAIFMQIAVIGYMMMLVYMGIRILLSSTGDAKAGYKKFFVDWVVGLSILLLFPYAMKYMIKVNEVFVDTIEANKGFESPASSPLENADYDKKLVNIDLDYEIDWVQGTDYMSGIAYAAQISDEPALSFAFLIMTWQLITLIFHYYKRLFMIAFLIIIFPLVAFSYAVDKIADGKSQAFNTWAKEFILNVFVQTFHAIVYVFVCTTVYSASREAFGDAEFGYDYILIMVGITFLFKGEEIIRQIFGQVSKAGTMKKLSDSAVSFVKLKAIQGGIKRVGEYTVGKKSVAYKLRNGVNEYKAYDSRIRAFDKTATKPEEYDIGSRLKHAPKKPGKDATEEEKKKYNQDKKYFNAAARLNNPKSHSIAELSSAINTLKDLAVNNPNHDVFKDTKYTAGQIAGMMNLDRQIQNMVTAGMSDVEITRDVTIRLGVIFEGTPKEDREKISKAYMGSLYVNGVKVSRRSIEEARKDIIEESQEIRSKVKFTTNTEEITTYKNRISDVADEMVKDYVPQEASQATKNKVRGFAFNLVTLKCAEDGVVGEKEFLESATELIKYKDDEEVQEMIKDVFESDIDLFIHSVAKKIEQETAIEENKKLAEELVNYYEDDARDGYFNDEMSIHEVLKNEGDEAATNAMLEAIYNNRQEAMNEIVENIAEQYLVDNEVDLLEGSYDTSIRTQDGLTLEELKALKDNALYGTFANIGSVFSNDKERTAGPISGNVIKGNLLHEEERRTGRKASAADYKRALDPSVSVQDFIVKNKEEREKIEHDHFMGDI